MASTRGADRMDRIDSKSLQPGETPGLLAKKERPVIMNLNEISDSKEQKKEILRLLALRGEEAAALHQKASEIRENHFGHKVFLYGFVYFSTFCRNDCNFCYYRRSNNIRRYRKTPAEILTTARELADSGVHLLDLTMGEDPDYQKEDFREILELTKDIKVETGLPVMISPGFLTATQLAGFRDAGTDWYALYQETHNRDLYKKLRWDQDYDQRMEAKEIGSRLGLLVEEGILTGVGESLSDIADSIVEMGRIKARQMRVMTFVPQPGSPMENVLPPDSQLELNIIAVLRLMYPEVLIPASLDVEGIAGLTGRIGAGANVVTSIIPPRSGFAGVAQMDKDVDEGGRTVEEVSRILREMGLAPATREEYEKYLKGIRHE